MTAKVIDIGEIRLKKEFQRGGGCFHKRLLLDPYHQTAECRDCGVQLGAWRVVEKLVNQWEAATEDYQRREAEIRAVEKSQLIRRASRVVDKAWRSRSQVPVCPHCHDPIFPEDGFGRSTVHRKMAAEQKAFNRARQKRRGRP